MKNNYRVGSRRPIHQNTFWLSKSNKYISLIEKNSPGLCLGVSVDIVIPVKTGI
jgi:hypothetical protein